MSKASETAAANATPPPAAETGTTEAPRVAVTFLRAHPAYGYFAGDTGEVTAAFAKALIESKHAEKAK